MVAGRTTVAVFFGGRSVEHDVSIVTAQQIMRAFDREQYDVVPVYISRDGKWYTGEILRSIDTFKEDQITSQDGVIPTLLSPDIRHHGLILNPLAGRFQKSQVKRIDIAFPAIHGSHGEDGTIQGLFELADIPYVGCGTLASALTNHKERSKQVLRQSGVPVLDSVGFNRSRWLDEPETVLTQIQDTLGFPVFIKPATLGSSIGVSKADDPEMLGIGIDMAVNFDQHVLVEAAVVGGIEINCAVMGYGEDIQASVLEQPISWDEFLSFENKYLQGSEGMKSAERIIPAPLSDDLTQQIQIYAIQAFKAVGGRGIARIDFLVVPEENAIYLNELNTMPGSLSFYLWQGSGMSASEVVNRLVKIARDAYADKRRNMYDYQTNLVQVAAQRGVGTKGSKGSKV